MLKRIVIITAIFLAAAVVFFALLAGGQPHKLKLFAPLLTKSLEQVRDDYAARSCREFSAREVQRGTFDALVTGYCKPLARDFKTRIDFLCAVGLNCACPAGRDNKTVCAINGTLTWSSCNDFNDQAVDYCHQTASQVKPRSGQMAADWNCFTPNSTVLIDDRPYLVTDRGGAITGRRFDIWFENCQDAFKVIGIYPVSINK